MHSHNEKELVAKGLKGQRLVIPDMRPIFAHWPSGQNENYQAMKDIIDERLAAYVAGPLSLIFGHAHTNNTYQSIHEGGGPQSVQRYEPGLARSKVRRSSSSSFSYSLQARWRKLIPRGRWWPTASAKQYQVMVDLIIWFGYWDDLIESLAPDPAAAEGLRAATKVLVRRSLGLAGPEDVGGGVAISNPLVRGFESIAEEVCAVYDEGERPRWCFF